jgi:hypothetical protein
LALVNKEDKAYAKIAIMFVFRVLIWLILATIASKVQGNADFILGDERPAEDISGNSPKVVLIGASMELDNQDRGLEAEYFRMLERQDLNRSVEIINSVPVAYFFDVFHGKFRLGIIGNLIPDDLSELVSVVNKKMMKRNKLIQLDGVKSVDVQSLFMHGIGVIQHLSLKISEGCALLAEMGAGDAWEGRQTELINALFDDLKDELAIDVQMQRESLELNTELQELIRSREVHRRDSKFASFRKRTDGRLALREEQQMRLINGTDAHLKRVEAVKMHGLHVLANVSREFETSKHAMERTRLRLRLDNDLRKLSGEISGIIAATKFRIEEELRLERETEETALNVLSAQHKSQTEELQKLVQATADELSRIAAYATGNVTMLVKGCATLLVALIIIVLVIETTTIVRSLYSQLWSKRIPMQRQPPRRSSWWSRFFNSSNKKDIAPRIDDVILSTDVKHTVRHASRIISEAAKHRTCLPHLLLFGYGGTGKSIVADAVAYDSGVSYATINASEILALGDQASLFLFDFLDKIKRGRVPTVVILDQVDEIIVKRELALLSNGCTESCFYVLLQTMREACPALSVILTTKLAVSDVDKAITDRIDYCVHLPLPTASHRLEYCLKRSRALFSPYLASSKVAEIEACAGKNMDDRVEIKRSTPSPESPETDVPVQSSASEPEVQARHDLDRLLSGIAMDNDDFDVRECIYNTVSQSAGWSFRDVDKLLLGVVSAVLSTVQCTLTSRIFLTELRNAVKDRSNMRDIH